MDGNRAKRYYSILLTAAMIILMLSCASVYAGDTNDTVSGEMQNGVEAQQSDAAESAGDEATGISADEENGAAAAVQQIGDSASAGDEATGISADPDNGAEGDISGEAPAGYNMWVSEGENWFYLDDSGKTVNTQSEIRIAAGHVVVADLAQIDHSD